MSKYLSFFPYVGGKFYMLKHILQLIPPHRIYVEAFGGSGKVLLNKPRSFLEVWNDYDRRIANLFHVVVFQFDEFYEKVRGLVYSRELYKKYNKELSEMGRIEIGDVDVAVKTYYVLHCMFSGGRNYCTGFAFGKVRNHALRYWKLLDDLVKVRERLSGVIIECDDFEKVIKRWDSEDTFFLLDPPYYSAEGYYNGFGKEDHERLLRLLKEVKGKWLLCGRANELYDKELSGYNRFEFEVAWRSYHRAGNSVESKPKVKEVLWCNYDVGKGLFK
jgi:DNA adenine methylase